MSYLDGDDVAGLAEAHLPDLATGAAADLAQVLQVVDLGLVPLWGGDDTQSGGGGEGLQGPPGPQWGQGTPPAALTCPPTVR